jgi:hypothetical protein
MLLLLDGQNGDVIWSYSMLFPRRIGKKYPLQTNHSNISDHDLNI